MSEAETVSVHQQFPTPCFPGVQTLCMVAHLETKHLGISQANVALPWFVSQHTSKKHQGYIKMFYVLRSYVGTIFSHDESPCITASTLQ